MVTTSPPRKARGWTSDGLKSFVWSEGDVSVLTWGRLGLAHSSRCQCSFLISAVAVWLQLLLGLLPLLSGQQPKPSFLSVLQICMLTFEHEMEKAFAFQASQDKVCSICMEVILEKASASERRFGILSNCNHTYCLSCIRQWRCAKQFENPIIK